MALGTGNLLLKRGTTIPESALLPKAMPAVQLVNISPVNTTGGTPEYAYVNFPNRLWIGMEGLTCDGGGFTGYETGSGNASPGSILPCNALGTQDLNRPLWMGAEIRTFVEVYEDANDVVPIILKADWANPSDVILVTQKSIFEWAEARFTKGGNSVVRLVETGSPNIDYIELQAPADVVDTNYILILPSNLPAAPQAGKVLTISSVNGNAATLTWSDAGSASSATVAETVTLEATNSTDATHYITFVDTATGNEVVRTDTGLTYNPSSNTLTATTFSGNATSASTATNANNINISTINSVDTSTSIVLVGAQSTGNQLPFIDSGLQYNANTDTLSVTGGVSTATVTASTSVTTAQIIRNNTIEINASGGSGTVIRGSQILIDSTDTRPVLTVMPEQQGGSNDQFVKIEGGDLYLGNKTITDAGAATPVNIIFDGATITGTTNRTTLTVVEPTQANTITLPNTSGTVAIVAGNTTEVQFNTSGVLDSDPNFTYTKSNNGTLTLAGTLALNGGSMTTSASNVNLFTGMTSGNITVGGASTTTVIGGNLTVSGTTTTVNAETVTINDNTIVLNNNEASTPTLNAGIEVERGTSSNVSLLWSEGSDKWSTTRVNADVAVYPNTFHPIVVADSNSTLHSTGSEGSAASGTVTFNGTISGTSLTANTVIGKLTPGMYIFGSGVTAGTSIVSQSSGTANGDGVYVVSNPHAIVSSQGFTAESGRLGNQYIHTASVKYLDVNNLVMSGSWTLNATITSNLDLKNGGLLLPYVEGTYHSGSPMSGLPEGQIAYDITDNRIVFNQGSSNANNAETTGTLRTIISTGNLTDITQVGTLTNNIFSVADATAVALGTSATAPAINIGTGAISSGTKTINIGTASAGGITTITIGGTGGTNTTALNSNSTTVGGTLAVTGTLGVTGVTTLTGALNANGGIAVDGSAFTVADTSGNTAIGGTLTVGGVTTLNGNVILGNDTADTIAFNGVITSSLKFGGSASDTTLTTLSAETTTNNVAVTLPNWAGRAVVMSTTETSGYLITSGGNNIQPSWTDPATIVVGGVKVNIQNTVATATRYPIPFLGSDRKVDASDPAANFNFTEGTSGYQNSYLYANMTGAGTATGTPNNYTNGLFYEVDDTSVGTLFCDYIGATLDCGSYS